MRVAIIGCNTAGATAATRLRRARPDWDIVLFERGDCVSYANCGMPYHLGLLVPDRSALFIETPESLRAKHRLDVRILSEVVAIDRAAHELRVRDIATGSVTKERYDKLLIAAGSRPDLPDIPGIDGAGVLTLWSIADMDRIQGRVEAGAKRAAVIGAGFVGCLVAEALTRRGIAVTLVEAGNRVLDGIDPEISAYMCDEIEARGVVLRLGETVLALGDAPGGGMSTTLGSGTSLASDFVVMAVGARPRTRLARDAGLELGAMGGIAVGPNQRSSDPDIYAAGDVAESVHAVTGRKALIQLAGPAQRQARIAADNISGLDPGWDRRYSGIMGSSIISLWGMVAGATGADERRLESAGIPFRSVLIHASDKAPYYPGAGALHLKLFFGLDGRVLGAHITGRDGVLRCLDTISTAMHFGARVKDLEELELAYSPPLGTVRDPVNIAGSAAKAILDSERVASDRASS